jgi:hypothetical protein
VVTGWSRIFWEQSEYSDEGIYQTKTHQLIMKRKGKLLMGAFVVLGAALFVFAPMIPQAAVAANVPSPYPFCGTMFAPPPHILYFVSPAFAIFHSGVVFVPQGENLWWIQPTHVASGFICG